VIVASHFDLSSVAQGGTRDAVPASTSVEPAQPFSAALQAASKVSQGSDSTNDGPAKNTRRQKADSGTASAPAQVSDGQAAVSSIPPQQTDQQQQLPTAQQIQVTNSGVAPLQALTGRDGSFADTSTAVADKPMRSDSEAIPAATGNASTPIPDSNVHADVSSIAPQPAVSQPQVTMAQPTQATNPDASPLQALTGGAYSPSDASAAVPSKLLRSDSAATPPETQSDIAEPDAERPVGVRSVQGQSATDTAQSPAVSSSSDLLQTQPLSSDTGIRGITAPAAPLGKIADPVSNAVANAATVAPSKTVQFSVGNAAPDAGSQTTQVVAANADPGAASNTFHVAAANEVPVAVSQTVKAAVTNAAPNAASQTAQAAAANVDGPSALPSVSQDGAANTVHDSVSKAVLDTVSNVLSNVDPAPVLHAAVNSSARAVAAATPGNLSTVQPIQPAAASQQANESSSASDSSGATDQFVSLTQQGGGFLAAVRGHGVSLNSASTSNLSASPAAVGKNASKTTTNDATGLKQHAQPASEQTGTQTGSQDASPSGDQTQSGASSQGQNTIPAPVNFANHAAAAVSNVLNTATASPAQTTSTLADMSASTAAKTPVSAAIASAAVPTELPIINTAKLIQNMGQSEMRVGMHSTEFGNISISTSTTRDSISAQISLDHGELAKVLAAHLPEMQAKMGGNQAVDVRIGMNSDKSGQGAGTSGSAANGSANQSGQSQAGRQQSGNTASSYAGGGVVERQFSPAATAAVTGYGTANARLDITV